MQSRARIMGRLLLLLYLDKKVELILPICTVPQLRALQRG